MYNYFNCYIIGLKYRYCLKNLFLVDKDFTYFYLYFILFIFYKYSLIFH